MSVNRSHTTSSLGFKLLWVFPVLTGCYCLADAAQALSASTPTAFRPALVAGLAVLDYPLNPFQPSATGSVNPRLADGLEPRSLARDTHLFAQDTTAPENPPAAEGETTPDPDIQVLVAEVAVEDPEGDLPPELVDAVYQAIQTRAGETTSRNILQDDINSIFATGFFSHVVATPEDTNLGVRVTFTVQPNPMLTGVLVQGREVMPQTVIDQIFAEQKGKIFNLNDLYAGIGEIHQWYHSNGYVLAQVLSNPAVSPDGIVTLEVAEGIVNDIVIRFLNDEGSPTNAAGNPIEGKTQEYVITREITTQLGEVFNKGRIDADLQRVFGLGIFDDVMLGLEPAQEDPREVTVVVNVTERNTGSLAAGLGLSSASGVFGTVEYSQNNLLGRGQRASLEGDIGSKQTTLTASLNSPGSIDGKPMVPENLRHAAQSVIDALRQDQRQPITQIDWSKTVLETEEFIQSAQEVGHQPLAALALNNLANLHSSPTARLGTLDEALAILDNVNSPALRMHFLLRQARVHRQLSEPNRALDNYIAALRLLTKYQHERDLSTLLGSDFLESLSAEWQIADDQTLQGGVEQIFDFVKLGILLDTTFTYSILGDYQAGLYLAGSQDVLTPASSLTKELNDFLNDDARIQEVFNLDDGEEESSDHESSVSLSNQVIRLIFQPLLPVARQSAEALLSNLPEAYRLQASRLLFFDFNEADSVARYEAQIDDYWQTSEQQFSQLFYLTALAVTGAEMRQYLSENSPYLVPIARDIHALLPSAYNIETQAWNADVLKEILAVSKDDFLKYLDGVGDDQLTDLVNNFSGLIDFLLQNISSGERFEKDTPEYYRRRVELSQAVLDSWPEQVDETQEFEWAKGFVLKWQADALYKLGDYAAAVNAYNTAIPWLTEAEEFYQNGSKVRNSKINDYLNQFKEGGFGTIVEQIILSQLLTASLNSADTHLLLNKPAEARSLYKEALGLSDKLGKIRTGWEFVYKQSERAEIFYGIAQAEAMLGNLEAAAGAIEEAIAINEASFPNEALSGGTGVLGLGFLYGYGVPYQGSVSGSFKFDTNNPWLAANSDKGFLVENRCSTVTQYFACKQKYFGIYIDLLMQRHQQNPGAGYDVLAFEASERAKAFSFRRPDSVVSAQDQFAPARSLADIQSAISDDDTLVLEFFLGEKTSYLWVLTGGSLEVHPLPPRAVIEAKAQEFYDLLTSPPGRARPKTTAEAGRDLSAMLFAPVAHQLGTQRLVIIADGFLQYLPFSVLPNPAPDRAPSETALQGEYGPVLTPLLLDHEIVHLPSASTLVALRQNAPHRPAPTKELAFFANPVFNHKDNRVEQVKLFDWSQPLTAAELAKVEVLYSEIPATQRELENILNAQLLPEDKVETFFGYDASLESALSPDLGQFRMVHFASHGIFNSKAPERSGVVLSGLDENGVVRSGLLSPTYAFNEMDLSATELVVLSGCRTGLSQGQIGREGVTGLTNGLFDAGAERVVASLWSVRDDATRELMNRFYQLMLDPENSLRPAAALTEAQRSMWNEPRWQTPYNWAAFTLQGEWQ